MVVLTELLPQSSSASSSTHNHTYVYDVFLSFRGVDTRNRFTDHLYNALLDAGFNTFLDDEEIETGEPLKPELQSAIKSSRAAIIVLSKNYASSTWCLDESVLILDQKMNCEQIVIPIFYDVEPTDVRKQQGSFGEAMAKHKRKLEEETNAEKRSELAKKMKLWKRALTQVADLKGKDAKDRKETDFIKEVVTDIHRRLRISLSNTLPPLIGMEDYIEFIGSWLSDGSCHNADILTIVGMSGIGKTSLARYVFGLHSSEFDKSSFIEGINARCKESYNGLLDLQKQLHGDISKNVPLQVNDAIVYTSKIENTLARKRVFIVLDDIGNLDQLNTLLGSKGLHPGSKVIITTKDASLTESCALFNSQVHRNHNQVSLIGLYKSASLELLCIHAFKSNKPKEGYEKVSEKLVKYCQGHPLALQLFGRSLQKQDVPYWEECIKVLKKEPHSHINNALKMSFDALQFENDKELFKHIACFFVGIDQEVVATILDACDINTRYGITNLVDKCLISIKRNNKLMMHQLIQEMGRDLIRQESRDKPWERSRLWCSEESFKVLEENKGTENIIGLALDMRMIGKDKSSGSLHLETNALSKMENLKLLQLNYVKINGFDMYIPKQLRWLCMHGSHFKSIPSELWMEHLVVLNMSHSNIKTFNMSRRLVSRLKGLIGSSSKGKRMLGSLKILDLGFCEKLRYCGGFSELPALERLIVGNCISLIEVCESIEQCVELVHIDLSYCYKLKNVPTSIWKLKKLKTLLLDGINACESQIETISCDFKFFEISLPSSLRTLSLANNNLCNESFPMDFSCLSMLEELRLDKNPIVSMPNCVRTLPMLQRLYMNECDKLISIDYPPRTLRRLSFYSSKFGFEIALRKIKFDPEMSPLDFFGLDTLRGLSNEIDGRIKIQPMANVEEKILQSLGWINLEFIKEMHLNMYGIFLLSLESVQTQMYYEFGIFSTIYVGEGMPEWITCKSKGGSISFTIPSSPNKLKGLNFCCCIVPRFEFIDRTLFYLPVIKISNITKNHTWIYQHYIGRMWVGGKCCLVWLSHWMFGPNEMKAGDLITITVANEIGESKQVIKECGIGVVYEDDSMEEEEEDVLDYYKSWNHIIGGDLSPFQLTTGEYLLDYDRFALGLARPSYFHSIDYGATHKEKKFWFKAFSGKMKSEICVGKE